MDLRLHMSRDIGGIWDALSSSPSTVCRILSIHPKSHPSGIYFSATPPASRDVPVMRMAFPRGHCEAKSRDFCFAVALGCFLLLHVSTIPLFDFFFPLYPCRR